MKVLAIILAGGKRKELMPLVEDRCKAAVPFLGKYRVIDFVLSNCLNSQIRQINVVIQHRFGSLLKHIRDGWNVYSTTIGEYIDVYPPQQRHGEHWYSGSADAVYQNMFSIENENPDYVLTLSGDHIYKMNYQDLIRFHIEKKAHLTIASVNIPINKAKDFGVMTVDKDYLVTSFEEKPNQIMLKADNCMISMGLYVFSAQVLKDIFSKPNKEKGYIEFGRDIIPELVSSKRVYSYPFQNGNNANCYWNFLRNLKEYYNGNMDILNGKCGINIFDTNWPFRTYQSQSIPTRILSSGNSNSLVVNSLISGGGLIEGKVVNSILGTNVTVEPNAEIRDSILFDNIHVKKGAKITKAIIDKGIEIPNDCELDYNSHKYWDEFTLADDIIVLGKNASK